MSISEALQNWYFHSKRNLPWRKTQNPYHILVSEIILQQTKVEQGLNYYKRFIEKFPDLHCLATAPQDEVYKIWQGLGYYTRAKNLHHTAIFINKDLNGIIPDNFDQLIKLKGIGPYTAAAVASIAFKEAKPTIDGNVTRVLSRIFGIAEAKGSNSLIKKIEEKANYILDKENPGTHNQALMELGALVCIPNKPNCSDCPVAIFCHAYNYSNPLLYPVKIQTKQKKKRYFNYFFIIHNNKTFLQKRQDKDIWQGLYEPILIETENKTNWKSIIKQSIWAKLFPFSNFKPIQMYEEKHILSHQEINLTFYVITPNNELQLPENVIEIALDKIDLYPISRAFEKFIQKLDLTKF